jgi:hypothetical protein
MESLVQKFPLFKFMDANEDQIVDTQGEIFETLLTLGIMKELKKHFFMSNPSIPDQLKVTVNFYTLEPSYQFPEFIHWSALHYLVSERVIMNYNGCKVLCRVDAQTFRDAFLVSESDINDLEKFNEEECFRFYNQVNTPLSTLHYPTVSKSSKCLFSPYFPY